MIRKSARGNALNAVSVASVRRSKWESPLMSPATLVTSCLLPVRFGTMTDFMSKRPARGGGDARSVSRELNANGIHWDTLNFGRLDVTDFKERETGIEPATSSLGKWTSIENKQQSRLRRSFLATRINGDFDL